MQISNFPFFASRGWWWTIALSAFSIALICVAVAFLLFRNIENELNGQLSQAEIALAAVDDASGFGEFYNHFARARKSDFYLQLWSKDTLYQQFGDGEAFGDLDVFGRWLDYPLVQYQQREFSGADSLRVGSFARYDNYFSQLLLLFAVLIPAFILMYGRWRIRNTRKYMLTQRAQFFELLESSLRKEDIHSLHLLFDGQPEALHQVLQQREQVEAVRARLRSFETNLQVQIKRLRDQLQLLAEKKVSAKLELPPGLLTPLLEPLRQIREELNRPIASATSPAEQVASSEIAEKPLESLSVDSSIAQNMDMAAALPVSDLLSNVRFISQTVPQILVQIEEIFADILNSRLASGVPLQGKLSQDLERIIAEKRGLTSAVTELRKISNEFALYQQLMETQSSSQPEVESSGGPQAFAKG
jgi:hypothetical protein